MTNLREAAQMALDWFEDLDNGKNYSGIIVQIEALRAALAQTEQEPVAWITTWNEPNDAGVELHWVKQDKGLSSKHTPLYTAAPQQPEQKAQFEFQNYGWWRDEEGKLQLGTQPQGE